MTYLTITQENAGGGSVDLAPLNMAIANAEAIARSDTLQAGEAIAEAGEIHNYAGRAWLSLIDNAVAPDPLSIAALEASTDFEEFTVPSRQYRRLFPDAISSNFTTWDNPNDLTLVLLFADGDTDVTFGRFNDPQTLTIPDLGARLFQFEGTGWFPVTPDSTPSSRLFRGLDSWDVNGTNTRVHPPELLGNVEVVAVEDAILARIGLFQRQRTFQLTGLATCISVFELTLPTRRA